MRCIDFDPLVFPGVVLQRVFQGLEFIERWHKLGGAGQLPVLVGIKTQHQVDVANKHHGKRVDQHLSEVLVFDPGNKQGWQ